MAASTREDTDPLKKIIFPSPPKGKKWGAWAWLAAGGDGYEGEG